jgi:hypothetical protein
MANWSGFLGALGIGSLLGSVITQFVSAKLRHREWVNDNKREEWRELITGLSESIERMGYAFEYMVARAASDPLRDWLGAMGKGNRLVRDRIFIAETIKRRNIVTKWDELMKYVISRDNPRLRTQQGETPTPNGFNLKAVAFQDELIRVCREDLGMH